MIGGNSELGSRCIVPDHGTMNTGREKLRKFLNRRVGCRAKRVFAPIDGLPFLNFVSFESERMRIGNVCFAQVLHRDGDARLAIARSKPNSLSIHVEITWLVSEGSDALDLQIEHVPFGSAEPPRRKAR